MKIDKRKKIYRKVKRFFQMTGITGLMCGGLIIGSLQSPPPEVKAPTIPERVEKVEKKVEVLGEKVEKIENKLAWEYVGTRVITAYSSTLDQTDSTPFITAYGTEVREGIIASNEFEKGTILRIAGEEYVVEDRMNARYPDRLDIWYPTRQEALNWGIRTLEVYKK